MPDMINPANGHQGADAQQALDGYLADVARQNPSMAWLSQMITLQRQQAVAATAATSAPLDDAKAEIEALTAELARAEARIEKLTRANEQLAQELDAACERVADAAAAVGA
jgi:predicted  nucleic acid-binding Zn-ribbon protein